MEITYLFSFDGKPERRFRVVLDPRTLEQQMPPLDTLPEWTRLEFHQCPNCPLTTATHTHCPVAVTLYGVVEFFNDIPSYHQMDVKVVTPERIISAHTTAQKALSSLMGLLIPTSGCPRMALFKPMARFHLPFSSEEETIYRASSMYLLAQYFKRKDGRPADLELMGLATFYRQVEVVNKSIYDRLKAASTSDASVNAVILLDLFAKAMPDAIEESLEEIRYLFEAIG